MIWISSNYDVFTWNYQTYKYNIAVKTDEILMATQHRVQFEMFSLEFDNLFDYNFREGAKLTLLNILIIHGKSGIIIDHTDHILKKILHSYW